MMTREEAKAAREFGRTATRHKTKIGNPKWKRLAEMVRDELNAEKPREEWVPGPTEQALINWHAGATNPKSINLEWALALAKVYGLTASGLSPVIGTRRKSMLDLAGRTGACATAVENTVSRSSKSPDLLAS